MRVESGNFDYLAAQGFPENYLRDLQSLQVLSVVQESLAGHNVNGLSTKEDSNEAHVRDWRMLKIMGVWDENSEEQSEDNST
jgi:hypothetical protein